MSFPRMSVVAVLFALLLSVDGTEYNLSVSNCGLEHTYTGPPSRAITMHQPATEVMLALGLGSQLRAAEVDSEVAVDETFKEELDKVTIKTTTSGTNPPAGGRAYEALEPDFIYGSFNPTFREGTVNYTQWEIITDSICDAVFPSPFPGETRSCRPNLHDHNIGTYLRETHCFNNTLEVDDNWENVKREILTVARIFDVESRGEAFVKGVEDDFELVKEMMAEAGRQERPLRALWLNSWYEYNDGSGRNSVSVGASGPTDLIMRKAGLENVAKEWGIKTGYNYVNTNTTRQEWKDFMAADPDVVILVESSWQQASDKATKLCDTSNPAAEMEAVRGRKMIVVPFSSSRPGATMGKTALHLAIAALHVNGAIDTVEAESHFKGLSAAKEGFPMAHATSHVGYFLSIPETLHDACPPPKDFSNSHKVALGFSNVEDLDAEDIKSTSEGYRRWTSRLESMFTEMLEESCKGNPDKCSSNGISVEGDILTWSLSPGRRSLRQSGLSVNAGLRVTGSSENNTEEVIRKIEDNPTLSGLGSISEAGDMEPQEMKVETKIVREESDETKVVRDETKDSDGMYDGGVAGIAVGLFFAGVFITLIVCYILYKTARPRSASQEETPCCIPNPRHGSFQRLESTKQHGNPTADDGLRMVDEGKAQLRISSGSGTYGPGKV